MCHRSFVAFSSWRTFHCDVYDSNWEAGGLFLVFTLNIGASCIFFGCWFLRVVYPGRQRAGPGITAYHSEPASLLSEATTPFDVPTNHDRGFRHLHTLAINRYWLFICFVTILVRMKRKFIVASIPVSLVSLNTVLCAYRSFIDLLWRNACSNYFLVFQISCLSISELWEFLGYFVYKVFFYKCLTRKQTSSAYKYGFAVFLKHIFICNRYVTQIYGVHCGASIYVYNV